MWRIEGDCICWLHLGSNCSLTLAMDGRVVRRGIISFCQSAATYCKALQDTSLNYVCSNSGGRTDRRTELRWLRRAKAVAAFARKN